MRYFSEETRIKLSEAARRRWAREREAGVLMRNQEHFVTNVADDNVTATVEILRKLMTTEALIQFLSRKAYSIIEEAVGTENDAFGGKGKLPE